MGHGGDLHQLFIRNPELVMQQFGGLASHPHAGMPEIPALLAGELIIQAVAKVPNSGDAIGFQSLSQGHAPECNQHGCWGAMEQRTGLRAGRGSELKPGQHLLYACAEVSRPCRGARCYPFSSFFSSLRKRQSVPWAMIFYGVHCAAS
jgi:hypothetical protein